MIIVTRMHVTGDGSTEPNNNFRFLAKMLSNPDAPAKRETHFCEFPFIYSQTRALLDAISEGFT